MTYLAEVRGSTLDGPRIFPSLSASFDPAFTDKGSICFVISDLGASRGGEVELYLRLAESVGRAGHRVSILSLGEVPAAERVNLASKGLVLVEPGPLSGPNNGCFSCQNEQVSFGLYHFLKNQAFDVVHFADTQGLAYFSLVAKREGLAFPRTLFVLGLVQPSAWLSEADQVPMPTTEYLAATFMERASAVMADVAWSPSQAMLEWLRSNDWSLGDAVYCQLPSVEATPAQPGPVEELVVFPWLETLEGLYLFCDAIDKLQGTPEGRAVKVTFLGEPAFKGPLGVILRQLSSKWRNPVSFIPRSDTGYAAVPGRLAVLSSTGSKAFWGAIDFLRQGLAFVAAQSDLLREFVALPDQVLFRPTPAGCAGLLRTRLSGGAAGVAPAAGLTTSAQDWVLWHDRAVAAARRSAPPHAQAPLPAITVCVAHFNRSKMLRRLLENLTQQTYRNFEVVVIDDGSTNPEDIEALVSIESWLEGRGWRLVRQENAYLGAVRNRGVEEAKGEYVYFMDDDDLLAPQALEVMAAIVSRTGADVLSNSFEFFDERDGQMKWMNFRYVPLAGSMASSLWTNTVGGSTMLVRRSAYLAIGGSTTDFGIGHEDWELLVRACLEGLDVVPVPEPLAWVRYTPQGMSRNTNAFRNHRRGIRPIIERVPPYLRTIVCFTQDMMWNMNNMRKECDRSRDVVVAMQKDMEKMVEELNRLRQEAARSQLPGNLTQQNVIDFVDAKWKNQACPHCGSDVWMLGEASLLNGAAIELTCHGCGRVELISPLAVATWLGSRTTE